MESLVRRGAADSAGFLIPHLRPGLRLLDCGCGPGSITVGLAQAVAPGETVGIDLDERVLRLAAARAEAAGVKGLRVQTGNVYQLPFESGSFDVVYANTVLFYLKDPLRALREIRRVLKSGGVAGISDPDWGLRLREPTSPPLEEMRDLMVRAIEESGGSPFYARHQRSLLLEAGFSRTQGFAKIDFAGTLESTRGASRNIFVTALRSIIIDHGWVDAAAYDRLTDELESWGNRPDAFMAALNCQALGWA